MSNFHLITSPERQTTLDKEFVVSGVSVNGRKCQMICRPAVEGSHISFLGKKFRISALINNLYQSANSHTTCLRDNRENVIESVEHVLSAFWGMGVDNAELSLPVGEIPFADASAEEVTKLISGVGVKELKENRTSVVLDKKIIFSVPNDERYCRMVPRQGQHNNYTVTAEFPSPIGRQTYKNKIDAKIYRRDIAPARTFLRSPLDRNGVVWKRVRDKYPFLSEEPGNSPIIVYTDEYFITKPTNNEMARHKLLDYFGDISLLGFRISADVELFKPGHKFTHHIIRRINKELAQNLPS